MKEVLVEGGSWRLSGRSSGVTESVGRGIWMTAGEAGASRGFIRLGNGWVVCLWATCHCSMSTLR